MRCLVIRGCGCIEKLKVIIMVKTRKVQQLPEVDQGSMSNYYCGGVQVIWTQTRCSFKWLSIERKWESRQICEAPRWESLRRPVYKRRLVLVLKFSKVNDGREMGIVTLGGSNLQCLLLNRLFLYWPLSCPYLFQINQGMLHYQTPYFKKFPWWKIWSMNCSLALNGNQVVLLHHKNRA